MKTSSLYTFALIILFAPLLGKLIKNFYDFYKLNKDYKRGNNLLELLFRITPREFEIWSSEYLASMGFNNIVISPFSDNNNRNILCTKDSNTYTVHCKRKEITSKINKNDIEQLLGSLLFENVQNGILVTPNAISEDALDFIKNLKEPYTIQLITFYNENIIYRDFLLQTD